MKKLLLLFTLFLISHAASASFLIRVDGISYELFFGEDRTACRVTYGDTKYSGDIVIPASIEYGENTYTVTEIGYAAFYECHGVTSVVIPNTVTEIHGNSFLGCTGLTAFQIPSSVKTLGNSVFAGCTGLTTMEIPSTVTSIGESQFDCCSCLESITGKYASEDHRCLIVDGILNSFARVGLTSYQIPSTVTKIGKYAFWGCTELTSVQIPSTVTEIDQSAFGSCTGLTTLEIPSSVTAIGLAAFSGCTALTTAKISARITEIAQYTFQKCSSLRSIDIPKSVTVIGEEAFRDCIILPSIVIPASVTQIGNNAFYGCRRMTSVASLNTTPPTVLGSTAFDIVTQNRGTLKVPEQSLDAYKSAKGWQKIQDIRALTEEELNALSIPGVLPDPTATAPSFTLSGTKATENSRGILIQNGKKIFKK